MLYSSTANNRHRESYISRAMVSYLGAHPARGEPRSSTVAPRHTSELNQNRLGRPG